MRVVLLLLSLLCSVWSEAASPPTIILLDDAPEVAINATDLDLARGTLTQPAKFLNPSGRRWDGQIIRVEITSPTPVAVEWDTHYQARHGFMLPRVTTGNNTKDLWGFQYELKTETWSLIATTQPLPDDARRGR